jgi:hypothetical protein
MVDSDENAEEEGVNFVGKEVDEGHRNKGNQERREDNDDDWSEENDTERIERNYNDRPEITSLTSYVPRIIF